MPSEKHSCPSIRFLYTVPYPISSTLTELAQLHCACFCLEGDLQVTESVPVPSSARLEEIGRLFSPRPESCPAGEMQRRAVFRTFRLRLLETAVAYIIY